MESIAPTVVLLHGLASNGSTLEPLARFLAAIGFKPRIVDYPSRQLPIEGLAWYVHSALRDLMIDGSPRFHVVAHSLGGIIVQELFRQLPVHARFFLGRVVMLGTPNQGSELAEYLMRFAWYRHFWGPAGSQIAVSNDLLWRRLGSLAFPTGIIAGTQPLFPFSHKIFDGANDGAVAAERTKAVGMQDWLAVPTHHFGLRTHPNVFHQIRHFLVRGRFCPAVATQAFTPCFS